jgi:hypothetical protein
MAMRDPGPPGRNPFFDHVPDDEALDELGELPWAGGPVGAGAPGGPGGPDPLGTLAALVDALQQAQPEATEHLVTAAHELVLAVKCVVDATEAVLAAQRVGEPEVDAGPRPRDEPSPPSSSGVRRIDLA